MQRKLTDLLPERYCNSPEISAAAGILWVLGEVFREYVLDWLDQLCIDSVTWGIRHWERIYGVTPMPADSIETRRGRVKAKMRIPKTTTIEMLKNVAEAYAEGAVSTVEELPREHCIKITYISTVSRVDLAAIQMTLWECIPSHVVFDVIEVLQRDATARIWTAGGGTQRRPHREGAAILPRGAYAHIRTAAASTLHKTFGDNEVIQ